MTNKTACVLAGDIGGTHTRLAITEVSGSTLTILAEHSYPSRHYASLHAILDEFMAQHHPAPDAACFGVAGPVHQQSVTLTNLPWQFTATAISEQIKNENVSLLNDLEATAWGLRTLKATDFYTLQSGKVNPDGNAGIIAAGTGLGEAGLCRDGGDYRAFATEGGHTDFSPGNDLEIKLYRFLAARHSHVSWERILSGPGLVMLHAFLCEHHQQPVPDWLQQETEPDNTAALISEAAQNGRDAVCLEALEWFVHLYGVEAGNLALKLNTTGGLYIGGGIAPKILAQLTTGTFMSAFCAKGRMQHLLEAMSVQVVLNDRAALYGSAVAATTRLHNNY